MYIYSTTFYGVSSSGEWFSGCVFSSILYAFAASHIVCVISYFERGWVLPIVMNKHRWWRWVHTGPLVTVRQQHMKPATGGKPRKRPPHRGGGFETWRWTEPVERYCCHSINPANRGFKQAHEPEWRRKKKDLFLSPARKHYHRPLVKHFVIIH